MRGNEGGRPDTQAIGWAQGLGEERHARDECAARTAKSREEEAERMTAVVDRALGGNCREDGRAGGRLQRWGEARGPDRPLNNPDSRP